MAPFGGMVTGSRVSEFVGVNQCRKGKAEHDSHKIDWGGHDGPSVSNAPGSLLRNRPEIKLHS